VTLRADQPFAAAGEERGERSLPARFSFPGDGLECRIPSQCVELWASS
jgi:hypothetical protein